MSGAAIIIPARFASTRLPGKLLLAESGRSLIQHTFEQAALAKKATSLVVATDDERIFEAVKGFGGDAVMTSAEHESGSARVAEAAKALDAEIIINLQGDEPEIDPAYIDFLIDIMNQHAPFAGTLACRFDPGACRGSGSPDDPACVKAILGASLGDDVYRAAFFAREVCTIPKNDNGAIVSPERFFMHVGIYGFTKDSLLQFANSPPGALEQAARLEQLRILEMGQSIAVGIIPAAAPGIDTREDYEQFLARCA